MSMTTTRALVLALLCSAISACTTVETIELRPSCTPPALPALPVIESRQLEGLDDTTFWALMERERRLTDWALELEAMLSALCAD